MISSKPQKSYSEPHEILPEEVLSSYKLDLICFRGDQDPKLEGPLPDKLPGWYGITHQGQVVSQLSLSHHQVELYGSCLRIGSVGGVGTHPDYRGLGLAGRLLAHSAQQFVKEGARLMLISGGRGLYTRTGNVPAMELASFTLRAPLEYQPDDPAHITLRPLTLADQGLCARLYQAEPVRFVRRQEDFQGAFHYMRGWMIEQDGVPRAYLLLHTPWEYMDSPEQGIREVTEYAGSCQVLAAGLRTALSQHSPAFNQSGIHELHMAVPWQDVDLIHNLKNLRSPAETISLPGHTMRLVNFAALRHDLSSYITGRLPASLWRGLRFEQSGPLLVDPATGASSDGRMAIAWKGKKAKSERLELSSAEMTNVVMGGGSPLQLRGALGEIVPALFPLPSFLIGLNYR